MNHTGYLRDPTGNRRFWAVHCDGPIDVLGLARARDQLWAEAVHLHAAGESWHLSEAEEARMAEEHEERREIDPWEETLATWLDARDPRATFTMNELLESALGLCSQRGNPRVTMRVHGLLTKLGFERRRRGGLPRLYHYARAARLGDRLGVSPSPSIATDLFQEPCT